MEKKSSFHEMIPDGWCKDPDKSKFLFRLYSIVPCSIAQLTEFSSGQTSFPQDDGVPIWLGLCDLHADQLLSVETGQVHSDPETGTVILPNNVRNLNLPRSAYMLLATPHAIDGVEFKEPVTRSRLDRVEALLSIYFGSNAVYRQVFQAIFEAQPNGQYSLDGDVMAVIQSSNGPNMSPENWRLFEETSSRIDGVEDTEKKARIRRSLEFYQSGKASHDTALSEKFFFYWTAIQILCEGGGTMQTNRQLQSIYGFSKEQVEADLLWKGIVDLRNSFFHAGVKIELYKDAERYLQFLFLDLLRHELDLNPVGAALSSQSNLDLSLFKPDILQEA
ncbi:hypothetical protein [Thalassovita sp.]|uniref:hypothetical protein n=1 Tax=Thalassovita sp. TaxID=1979401 RepID=UPI002B270591|nr:hypothetical protein [Thalassovita sp.]